MKYVRRMLLAATAALALGLSLVSAAPAQGGAADGHTGSEGPLGVLLLPPEFVLDGVAFFGVLCVLRRRRG